MDYRTQGEYNDKRERSKKHFERNYYRRKLRDFFIMHIYGKKVSAELIKRKYIEFFGVDTSDNGGIINQLIRARLITRSSKNWHETDNTIYEFDSTFGGFDISFPKLLMFVEHCVDHDDYNFLHLTKDSILIKKNIKTHKVAFFNKSYGNNTLSIGFGKGDLVGVMPSDFDNINFQIKDDKYYLTFLFESSLFSNLENFTTVKSRYNNSNLTKINSECILLDIIEYDISLMEDDYFGRLENALHEFKHTNLYETLQKRFNLYI